MKKFVNDPKSFVPEMLEGLALANPNTLRYEPEWNLIMRADAPAGGLAHEYRDGIDALRVTRPFRLLVGVFCRLFRNQSALIRS